jgi:hypothetical protein
VTVTDRAISDFTDGWKYSICQLTVKCSEVRIRSIRISGTTKELELIEVHQR